MGMGPIHNQLQQPAAELARQQQQAYVDQFNSAAYAPIPGYGGNQSAQGLLGAQQPAQAGWQSQWDAINGRLIGDTYLPPDVSLKDVGKGWYEVHHGGGRVGTLRPGGKNGRFLNDTDWQIPQPALVGGPPAVMPGGGAGSMPQPQPFAAAGPYGAQAMQMAGLLAQPPQQQPTTGLLGGPKRGFRIPGGK